MFEPTRLTAARKRRGWSLTQLAEEAKLSRASLSAYENDKSQPTDATIERLARCLDVDVAFLHGQCLDQIPEEAVSFRARAKMPSGVRDRALMSGRIALLVDEWISTRFDLPKPDVPLLEEHDPELAALELRAKWGLGERPISNMVHLAESHGVRIYSLTTENATLDGYSLFWNGRPFIFLSTVKSPERGRFDAAHELGHLVLHHGARELAGPDAERQADRFASAFLMPRGAILAQGLRNAGVPKVLIAKKPWKVSAMALAVRINQLGLMSEWAYRSLVIGLSQRGYRSSEPGGMASREGSQLLAKVVAELRQRGDGVHTIAADVGLSANEISDHLFGLVPIVLPGGGSPKPEGGPRGSSPGVQNRSLFSVPAG